MIGSQHFLIVDDHPQTFGTIVETLEDAQVGYQASDSVDSALSFLADSDITTDVVIRGRSDAIDGLRLCQSIREWPERSALNVFVLLDPDQLHRAADFLLTGVHDLLVGSFEPRELRMRAGIIPADQQRRVDAAHTVSAAPNFHVPEFNPNTMKFDFGRHQQQVTNWEHDDRTCKVPLDTVVVCPACESLPTVRSGCGACGSAWVDRPTLIHHYACAHVAVESEFRDGDRLNCPKCRLTDLVAGSDFEQTPGSPRCRDCGNQADELQWIGHCLSCQHRFLLQDGSVRLIHGYQVGGALGQPLVPAPNIQNRTAGDRQPTTKFESTWT